MKTYTFGLKHDSGEASITVRADDVNEAKKMVMDLEKCPERAITWWRIVPTTRQIQKTKNLLRGL
jgi:hypothetical protein